VCVADVGSSSLTTSEPVRAPAVLGVKLTWIVQVTPGAKLAPQVLDWAKSPAVVMEAIASGASPWLASVAACVVVVPTTCGAKFSLVVRAATGAIPVPEREAEAVKGCCVLMASVAVLAPRESGVKVTVTAQLAPGERKAGQLLVCVKS